MKIIITTDNREMNVSYDAQISKKLRSSGDRADEAIPEFTTLIFMTVAAAQGI